MPVRNKRTLSTYPKPKLGMPGGIYREAVKGFLIKFTQDRSGSRLVDPWGPIHTTVYIGKERKWERERVATRNSAFCYRRLAYPAVCRLVSSLDSSFILSVCGGRGGERPLCLPCSGQRICQKRTKWVKNKKKAGTERRGERKRETERKRTSSRGG